MNVDNILKLADHIESLETTSLDSKNPGFCMGATHYSCGTAACILGHACHLAEDSDGVAWLKLDHVNGATLFTPIPKAGKGIWNYYTGPGEPGHITAKHAAACLRLLARTGKVDWERSYDESI